MYTTLIEPAELAASLTHTAAQRAIVDCRFDLARPDWGEAAYAAGHVPSALYAHLDRDLSGPISPTTGRHPLPSPDRLADTLGSWGIDASVQVVAYDQGNGAYASRLWWLLRWAGHQKVAVLNGGFAAWQQAGLPIETTMTQQQRRTFSFHSGEEQVANTAELERAVREGTLASGTAVLVDARATDRFAGENETIDPIAGHIPGARNHPFSRNLDAQGRFLPAEELRERWTATLGAHAVRRGAVIAMCGSGVTACHNLLALQIAGLGGAKLYAGSWSEWIRSPEHPVAKGAA
jgi:thiosulfate/3-mercaptopyruvate sulfurtransferase